MPTGTSAAQPTGRSALQYRLEPYWDSMSRTKNRIFTTLNPEKPLILHSEHPLWTKWPTSRYIYVRPLIDRSIVLRLGTDFIMPLRYRNRARPIFIPPTRVARLEGGFTPVSTRKILKTIWLPALIFLVALIVYWPARLSGFVSDDFLNHIHFNYDLNDYIYWITKIRAHDMKYPFFRPVVWLSYRLDYMFFGDNPVPMHIVSIALHGVNAILVYVLASRLGLKRIGATVSALFFVTYPAGPEAVTWLSGRYDVLACTFTLLTAIFWCEARLRNDIRWMLPGLIAYFLAIHSKEVGYAAILSLPIIDWMLNSISREKWGKAGGGVGWNWKWYLVFFAVFLCSVGFRVWLYNSLGGYTNEHNKSAYLETGFSEIYSNLVAGDLAMLFTPVSRILWPEWPIFTRVLLILSGVLLLIGIVFSTFKAIDESRKISDTNLVLTLSAIIWILIFLAPVVTVVGVKSSLDFSRFLYIPAIGLAFLLGVTAETFSKLTKPFRTATAVVLLLSLILSGSVLSRHNRSWLEAGAIASRLAGVMDQGAADLPDNSKIYLINFPWLWKGAHCAPVEFGGWLEYKHGTEGTDIIELGTSSNPYVFSAQGGVYQWWTESIWNYHALGFVWHDESNSIEAFMLKDPRDIDPSSLSGFFNDDPPLEPIETDVFPE